MKTYRVWRQWDGGEEQTVYEGLSLPMAQLQVRHLKKVARDYWERDVRFGYRLEQA